MGVFFVFFLVNFDILLVEIDTGLVVIVFPCMQL